MSKKIPPAIQLFPLNRYFLPGLRMPEEVFCYLINGKEYFLQPIEGISNENISGASERYHKIGTENIPKLMIEKKTLFKIIQREDYCNENIVEVVTDLNEAKKVLDEIVKEKGNIWTDKEEFKELGL